MKVIIAGSRCIDNQQEVFSDLGELLQTWRNAGFDITEVISGTAKGVDQIGEEWAALSNIPVKRMPANWKEHGKVAGLLRNIEMAKEADALIAFWDGLSTGTAHMIATMVTMEKPVYYYIYKEEDETETTTE